MKILNKEKIVFELPVTDGHHCCRNCLKKLDPDGHFVHCFTFQLLTMHLPPSGGRL